METNSGGEEPGEKRKRKRDNGSSNSGEDTDLAKYKVFTKPNYKGLFLENGHAEFTVYLESTEQEKIGNKNPITLTKLIAGHVKEVLGVYRVNAHKIGITFRKAAAANNFLKMEDFMDE